MLSKLLDLRKRLLGYGSGKDIFEGVLDNQLTASARITGAGAGRNTVATLTTTLAPGQKLILTYLDAASETAAQSFAIFTIQATPPAAGTIQVGDLKAGSTTSIAAATDVLFFMVAASPGFLSKHPFDPLKNPILILVNTSTSGNATVLLTILNAAAGSAFEGTAGFILSTGVQGVP